MTIERARTRAIPKPWGVDDLQPWSDAGRGDIAIGEIWYERPGKPEIDPSLLLKLLFTSQPLSIQVHPDDAFAHSMGQPNGKTEAWYVLSAAPEAKVALGLSRRVTPQQLRTAIDDGSIAELIVWRPVLAGDTVFVPAGTIHAIGAGLVIAELQQRSDTTFRLSDPGRRRELHVESAIASADAGPAAFQVRSRQFSDERTVLVSSPYFVFERISLPPASSWFLEAERETWFLVLSGNATAGSFEIVTGEAVFAQTDTVEIKVGATGMAGLIAYTGGTPVANLLRRSTPLETIKVKLPKAKPVSAALTQAKAVRKNGRLETIK
jgi:mannose-6-phosphate isomerase